MVIRGTSVSPGFVTAKAYVYKPASFTAAEKQFAAGEAEKHLLAMRQALCAAKAELDRMTAAFGQKQAEQAKIFAAHKEILEDEEILDRIRAAIVEERKMPDYAVQCVFNQFIEKLRHVKDPLIAARSADLCDVRNRLLRILHGVQNKTLSCLGEDVIVVAHDLLPSDTATIDRAHVKGLVTEVGGATSHTAILARSFQIPAVVGVAQATVQIQDGVQLALDAENGEVIVSPSAAAAAKIEEKKQAFLKLQKNAEKCLHKPAVTLDGQKIEIGVNFGSGALQVPGEDYDFVGLLRTEFLYMESDHFPTEEEQFRAYQQIVEAAHGKTVTLRTLDVGGDKTLRYMKLPQEANPFLGKRALRLCFDNPVLFTTQLRAALRASAFGPLQIMFPMVGSLEDIRRAKKAVEDVKMRLRREKKPFNEGIKLGIMIEIPSIALLADRVAKEVDFASIGTNDLTQYLCAADRMNPEVSQYYQSLSPAVLRLLRYIAEQFQKNKKPLSVCGELAGDPYAAVVLVGLGLRKLSMSPSSLARVKLALSAITIEQAGSLAQDCCQEETAERVKAGLQKTLAC